LNPTGSSTYLIVSDLPKIVRMQNSRGLACLNFEAPSIIIVIVIVIGIVIVVVVVVVVVVVIVIVINIVIIIVSLKGSTAGRRPPS